MIKRIGRAVVRRFLDVEWIRTTINQKGISDCYKEVTIGKKSVFYEQAKIFNFQSNKSKIKIGENTHIRGQLLVFAYGGSIEIGSNTYIGENSYIWSGEHINIGNNVLISHNVNIIDSNSHEIDHEERAKGFIDLINNGHPKEKGSILTAPIVIKSNAWINFNAIILKGVTIGEGAIVGAGSVVIKDVPDFALVVGNPAKIVKYLKGTNKLYSDEK